MASRKTDPSEAARRAEARAREAEQQFKPPAKERRIDFAPAEIWESVALSNERGDAGLVLKELQGRYAYDKSRKMMFRFNGHHWDRDILDHASKEACELLNRVYQGESNRLNQICMDSSSSEEERKTAEIRRDSINKRIRAINTRHRLENIMALCAAGRDTLAISGDGWNADPWALPVANGIVNLKTGEHRPGRPEDYVNKAAPTSWEGLYAKAPTWEAFLSSTFDGDADLVSYVQKVLGSAIVGLAKQQEFYILYGEGRNGKGTLIETTKDVFGPLVDPIRSEMVMEARYQQGSGANPEVLDLQGLRIVWASETKEGQSLNIEKVKLFTGSDTLKGRYNYSNDMIAFKPSHTLLLLTNHRPRAKSNEYALWQRLRLIPFNLSFVDFPKQENERQKDPDLIEKLTVERPGILAWFVRGCLDYQRDGLAPPRQVIAATEEYRSSQDMIQDFLNACCAFDQDSSEQAGKVYERFQSWHKLVYGERIKVPGLKTFSAEMQRKVKRTPGRLTYYEGLRLLNE